MRLYLKNYDRNAEMIAYDYPGGAYTLLKTEDLRASGGRECFGWFIREGDRVLGICASPDGPVLFVDNWCFLAEEGRTEAWVQDQVFHLRHGAREACVAYARRFGIGANPYDNEEEDIDLCALIASLFRSRLVFKAYSRDWFLTVPSDQISSSSSS
jgi:hypothetical protein